MCARINEGGLQKGIANRAEEDFEGEGGKALR